MRITPGLSIGLLGVLLSDAALAQPLPVADRPEDVGISSQRLERVRRQMKGDVESGRIPGAVLLIARNGRIASLDALGFQERRSQTPMKNDSIFRIASMSKPITSVAIMILAEEGKLDIGAPVAQYLHEFKDVKVGLEGVAPKRPMTVHDLLRHTSGLTYGIFGNSPVDEHYRKSNMFASKSLSEMVATIGRLPLAHQPGEVWEYSVSTDVLGRIVEVVSGMDLDRFVAEHITGPLQMSDTGFYLNASQAARLARSDSATMLSGADPTVKPAILSGGGGMLSTAGDYTLLPDDAQRWGTQRRAHSLPQDRRADDVPTRSLLPRNGIPPSRSVWAPSAPRLSWAPASASVSPSARTLAEIRFLDRSATSRGPGSPARTSGSIREKSWSPC